MIIFDMQDNFLDLIVVMLGYVVCVCVCVSKY